MFNLVSNYNRDIIVTVLIINFNFVDTLASFDFKLLGD